MFVEFIRFLALSSIFVLKKMAIHFDLKSASEETFKKNVRNSPRGEFKNLD